MSPASRRGRARLLPGAPGSPLETQDLRFRSLLSLADNWFHACRARTVKPRQSLSRTSQFTQGLRVVVSVVVVTGRPEASVVTTVVEVPDEPGVTWSLI